MFVSSHRRRYAYSLIEIMVVISILAVLLGMMVYRHSFTLTRSTFNQEVELFVANLKEMGTSAKRVGIILPASILSEKHERKDTSAPPEVIKNAYMVWLIKEKKSTNDKTTITASGCICSRSVVNVGISNTYTEAKSKDIKVGVWMDIYSMTDLKGLKTMKYKQDNIEGGPDGAQLQARIVFEPNQLPHSPGIITVRMPDDASGSIRGQRIDIERNGSVTVNTETADKKMGE